MDHKINCFLCGKPGAWAKETLKWVLDSKIILCEPHKTKLKEDLKDYKLEEKKEPILKTVVKNKDFIPKKVDVPRDFTEPREREANDGSLIE